MSNDNDELPNISRLIDKLTVAQTNNNDDNGIESRDKLLFKLHTELNSLEDCSYRPSTLDKLEQCFVKLSRLSSTSLLSSSPLLIGCSLIILQKLIGMDFLSLYMERNKSKADEYYTLAMDALNIRENLDYLQGNKNLATDLYSTYTRLYLLVARETIRFHNRASELLNVQEWNIRTSCVEQKYKPFLKILLSFIDKRLNLNEDVLYEMGFFISLSDEINCTPDLVECELPQHLKIWLLTYINNKELQDDSLCESILLIINNTARHEEGSNMLNNTRISDVLQDFWKSYGDNLSKHLIAVYYMAYALIVTPDQLKSAIILHDVIDYLIKNINTASCSSNMRTDSAHISEYLVALARLIVNDSVAQYIIDMCKINKTTDGLTFFNGLFQKYNELKSNDLYLKHLSRIALFNIFCSFSFQAAAQKSLASDKKFIEIIKNASHYNNEQDVVIQPCLLQHLSTAKQAAEAILINLDLYKEEDTLQIGASAKTMHHRIMISYSHKDKTFCRNLVRALKSNSIDPWVDEDGHCHSDDCWEEIAIAIKYASIVLVIVSPDYCQSVSCRKEATYADKRKKTLIALYPDDNKYEPDEWLDIRLTGTYVRFGENGKKSFDECISRLLEYIRPKEGEIIDSIVLKTATSKQPNDMQNTKIQSIEIVPSAASQSVNITKLSIHDWTKHDVQTWFLIERNLLPQLYKLYSFVDGDSLLEYAKHFIKEYEQDTKQQYEKLYKRLHDEFNIEFHDNNYTDLVSSMKKLLLTYDQQSLSITKTKKQKSSLCLIL
jgi:hypothetical protein